MYFAQPNKNNKIITGSTKHPKCDLLKHKTHINDKTHHFQQTINKNVLWYLNFNIY